MIGKIFALLGIVFTALFMASVFVGFGVLGPVPLAFIACGANIALATICLGIALVVDA